MTKKITCKICDTDRVEEETTGGEMIKRLEQNTKTYQSPCRDCIKWVEKQYDTN
jgi:iron-sulfur cluster repair protein YtfE (RIC family)